MAETDPLSESPSRYSSAAAAAKTGSVLPGGCSEVLPIVARSAGSISD